MADCFKYHEMISCLIDGQLDPAEKQELDEHLRNCEGCRALLDIYKLAFSDEQVEPPLELKTGSMLKVRAAYAASKRSNRRRITNYLAAAACFAVILLAVPAIPDSAVHETTPIEHTASEVSTIGGCDGNYLPDKHNGNEYLASVTINGELPDLLKEYEMSDVGNGSYAIKVRSCMVAYLDSLGYKPSYNSGSASDWSLVIYNP